MNKLHAKALKAVSSYACIRIKTPDQSILGIAIGLGKLPVKDESGRYKRSIMLVQVEDKFVSLHDIINLPETKIMELPYDSITDIEFA